MPRNERDLRISSALSLLSEETVPDVSCKMTGATNSSGVA
jgi:hypothetical protein